MPLAAGPTPTHQNQCAYIPVYQRSINFAFMMRFARSHSAMNWPTPNFFTFHIVNICTTFLMEWSWFHWWMTPGPVRQPML